MPEVTCDYMVPMTVRVDTDRGEVLEVWIHLESFQNPPRGWYASEKGGERLALRQAFLSTTEETGEFVDGESKLGDEALAIVDRLELATNEIELRGWTLQPLRKFAVCLNTSDEFRPDDWWIEFYDAENAEHAEEQALNANPTGCAIVCVATVPREVPA